jgi:hypothetical protein
MILLYFPAPAAFLFFFISVSLILRLFQSKKPEGAAALPLPSGFVSFY